MNFTTLQTRAKLRLGNMQSSSPWAGYSDEWVNRACDQVVLRALSKGHGGAKLNLFPELQFKWHIGPTIAGTEYMVLPGYDPITIDTTEMTSSGTTVTVDTTTHKMKTGDLAYIAGATDDTNYNGTYEVTVTDADTLTYTALTAPSTSPETAVCTITRSPKVLFVYQVYAFNKTGADVTSDERYWVTETDWRTMELSTKASTRTDYPKLWARWQDRLVLDPVPRASYTSDLYILGLKANKIMHQTTEVPDVDERWHDAILDMAVYIGAKEMGWNEKADLSLAACDRAISQTMSITGVENRFDEKLLGIKGDPTR